MIISPTLLLLSVLSLSLVVLYNLLVESSGGTVFSGTYFLCLTFFIASVVPMLWAVYSRRALLFDILVSYFFSISVAFAGLYQIATWRFPWPVVHNHEMMDRTILLYGLALLAYFVGRAFPDQTKTLYSRAVNTELVYQWAKYLLFLSVCILILTGPAQIFASRSDVGETLSGDGLSQISQIGKSACLTSALLFVSLYKNHSNRPERYFLWPAIVLTLLWFNPVASPRFQFIGCIVSLIVCFFGLANIGSASKAGILLFMTGANYFLLGPLKAFSGGLVNTDFGFFANLIDNMKDYSYRVDFDSLQASANVVTALDGMEYAGLKNFAGVFFFFVPRSIWSEKPYASSFEVMGLLSYDYLNLSFPLPMEFYYSGGAVALAFSCFACGLALRKLSISARSGSAKGFHLQRVGISLLCGFMPIILRGSIVAVVSMFGFCFLFLLFVAFQDVAKHFLSRKPNSA